MPQFSFIHAMLAVLQELDGEHKQMMGVLLRMQLEKEIKREEETGKRRALHHLQYSVCQGLWNMLFPDRMSPWTGEEPKDSEWVKEGDGRVRASFYTLQRAYDVAIPNWQWAGMMLERNYVGTEPRVTWNVKVPDHLEVVPVTESAQVGGRGSSSAVRFVIRRKVEAAKPEPAVPEPKGPDAVKAEVAAATDVQQDGKGKAVERPKAKVEKTKVKKAKVQRPKAEKAEDSPPADPPKVVPSEQTSSGAEGTKTGAGARQDSQGKATEKTGVGKGEAVSAAAVPPTKLDWADEEPTGVPPPSVLDTAAVPPRRDTSDPGLPPPSVQDTKVVPTPRVTSVPGVGGAAKPTVVQPATTKFGPWQDPQGKDLPCFAGASPGEVVLPVNMDPDEHIYPARSTVEALLNVRLWYEPATPACRHKRLRIFPARDAALPEAKALYGYRAFWVLAQWTETMDRKGIMISLLDFIRNFVHSDALAMAGRISSDIAYITGREMHLKPIKAIKLSGEQKQPQPQQPKLKPQQQPRPKPQPKPPQPKPQPPQQEKLLGSYMTGSAPSQPLLAPPPPSKPQEPWSDPAEWDKAFKCLRDQTSQIREYDPPVLFVNMWEKEAKKVASEEFKTYPGTRVLAEKIWEKVAPAADSPELVRNATYFVKFVAVSFAPVSLGSEVRDLEAWLASVVKDLEDRRPPPEVPKTPPPRRKTQDILKGDRVEQA
ncbi:hypothetical protein Hte_012564 [Hypoxylon texense]